jgi:hypothetical protein
LRHVALIGEQVVLADFVGFGNVSGLVIEYVILLNLRNIGVKIKKCMY